MLLLCKMFLHALDYFCTILSFALVITKMAFKGEMRENVCV